jgi:hypothetical protein
MSRSPCDGKEESHKLQSVALVIAVCPVRRSPSCNTAGSMHDAQPNGSMHDAQPNCKLQWQQPNDDGNNNIVIIIIIIDDLNLRIA